jgi:hypothetical protein
MKTDIDTIGNISLMVRCNGAYISKWTTGIPLRACLVGSASASIVNSNVGSRWEIQLSSHTS